ncbi:MAG: ATP-dependent Clp protease ATP-binding subunit, partial [Bacteroidales bacterium]|nr:ATP-dependent Clp protease ATP-binding subunit [Bacteroidales bacterium]
LEGRLDPIVGREKETLRLAQILSRRKKNNPVLIGEPGVGKSAIVEGLAIRIVQRKVSRMLFDKRVVSLDLASMVAGTKYRGQFEERMKAVLNELQKNPDIILFIDEIHTLVGAGNASGSMDAANMLKPALARGEIQCIGATTLDEYRKSIEKDGALERRFQKIIVDATTPEETYLILKNIKDRYEEHHNVTYSDEALRACVQLTNRYISDRNFPDKAIDALDEAGSKVHISNVQVPESIELLEKQIDENNRLKVKAVNEQNFELAADYRDKSKEQIKQLAILKEDWEAKLTENRQPVDEEKIAEVVAMMSGVPLQRIAQEEGSKLLKMKDELKGRIIGQDTAVDAVVKAIQRNRVGLKDPNKPIGTFLFVGPTGVGKTHLAKLLSEAMFDTGEALIRIDMSEFMEKFTVSRLVGAPPGYVGYEEGGQLTEKVRRRPYSVLLLDEIEKAHPDVFNLLLQVMDEGRLTDSLGRRVDFKNTILIMTSNVGTRQLKEFGKGIGFGYPDSIQQKDYSKSLIHKAITKTFAPEFLNRIDDTVYFEQLSKDSILKIIDLELKSFYQRVENLGYTLNITPEAINFIAEQGYDVQFGARPLKRAIQKYLEDELAEVILGEKFKDNKHLFVEFDSAESKIVLSEKAEK